MTSRDQPTTIEATVTPNATPHRHRTLSWRRLALFWVILALGLLVIAEGLSQVFWWAAYGVPPGGDRMLGFYPELRQARAAELLPTTESYDVLVLGGSVVQADYGSAVADLQEALAARLGRPVRITNLGRPAHSSLDSLWKYEELVGGDTGPGPGASVPPRLPTALSATGENALNSPDAGPGRYDLVLVYHGINELRANNCPASVFRADYGHYGWYRQIGLLRRHPWMRRVALPITLEHVWIRTAGVMGWGDQVSRQRPRPGWLADGAELKTPPVFETNLRAIAALATGRGEHLALGTFASYVPVDYTLERFYAPSLDYDRSPGGARGEAIEMWGLPANVIAGLAAHNAVVRRIAETSPGVTLVDLEQAIPRDGRLFRDICHLSTAGSARWASAVADTVCGPVPGSTAEAESPAATEPATAPPAGASATPAD